MTNYFSSFRDKESIFLIFCYNYSLELDVIFSLSDALPGIHTFPLLVSSLPSNNIPSSLTSPLRFMTDQYAHLMHTINEFNRPPQIDSDKTKVFTWGFAPSSPQTKLFSAPFPVQPVPSTLSMCISILVRCGESSQNVFFPIFRVSQNSVLNSLYFPCSVPSRSPFGVLSMASIPAWQLMRRRRWSALLPNGPASLV